MSCSICSNRLISALAAYAVRHEQAQPLNALADRDDRFRFMGPTEAVALLLYEANVKSFRETYSGRHADQIHPFAYDLAAATAARGGAFGPMAIIRAAHCLAYQSCQPSDWDGSAAAEVLAGIVEHALLNHPEYEATPFVGIES